MYLYCCILIGGAVILTSAESPSTHATSSHSYDRADVSLSYKYNLIHLYTTSKPLYQSKQNSNNKNQLRSVVNYQNIQYAPLLLKAKEKNSSIVSNHQEQSQKPELNTEINASMFDIENNEDRELRQEQKRNLFTLAVTEPIEAYARKYVPGYNVNLQAVINKLKQNGIYARNPNFLVKNKQVNVKYLQPQASYKNQNNLQGTSQNNEAKTMESYSMLTYKSPQDGKKNNGIIRPVNEHNENRPFFYVKAPKVELNLARAQHIARALHKASVNVNSSFRKLPSLPHEFFSNKQNLQPSNAKLIPSQISKVFITHRAAIK